MPIVKTLAVPYHVMEDYLSGNPTNRITVMANSYDKVWIISVMNPEDEPLVKPSEHCLPLHFHDVDDEEEMHFKLFNREMAHEVVAFLKKANADEGRNLLVVNCHAGVSRSGAISLFARGVFGLDYSEWRRDNPQVEPNLLVTRLLIAAWENSKHASPSFSSKTD